jgi:hypothetical protein
MLHAMQVAGQRQGSSCKFQFFSCLSALRGTQDDGTAEQKYLGQILPGNALGEVVSAGIQLSHEAIAGKP